MRGTTVAVWVLNALTIFLFGCGAGAGSGALSSSSTRLSDLKASGPILNENFNAGTLDKTQWVAINGPALNNDSTHSNVYSSANIDLSQGMMCIKLTQELSSDGTIVSTGGELKSKQVFGYGLYAFTMRMSSTSPTPDGAGEDVSGTVSVAFNYIDNSATEIDIEHVGNKPEYVYATDWFNPTPENPPTQKQSTKINIADSANRFHLYEFLWTPGKIEWYVDGNLVATHSNYVPSTPAYIVIHQRGVDGEWGGAATIGASSYMYIKNVSFTPLAQ